MFRAFLSLLLLSLAYSAYPTVVFHGINDNCPNQQRFVDVIEQGINAYVTCKETGADLHSILGNSITAQAELACELVKQDPQLAGQTINVVGQSQGSVIARYVVQKCDFGGRVDSLVTLGGPMQGVSSVPSCPPDNTLCSYLDYVIGHLLVYTYLIQATVAPAGYYKDQYNLQDYTSAKTLLARLNNEVDFDQKSKDRFSGLSRLALVKFSMDVTVIPKESAWFQFNKENSDELLAMEDTPLYTRELIGLKSLHQSNRIFKETIFRPHMHVSNQDILETVVPHLI